MMVPKESYEKLRANFLNFCSTNKLTVSESKFILSKLSDDLQKTVCSGEFKEAPEERKPCIPVRRYIED